MMDVLLPGGRDPAKLKFRTLWDNITIGSVTLSGLYRSSLTGTDGLTGFDCVTDIQAFFDSFAVLEVQYFPEDLTLTAGTMTTQLEATFQASTISSVPNAQDLKLNYKYRATTPGSDSKPQIWVTVYRVGATDRSDVEEIYESFECILPSDLVTRLVLGGNHYLGILDYKTDNVSGYGDIRHIASIFKWSGDGRLYWTFNIDTNANGMGVLPSVPTSLQTYQSVQFDNTHIPLGVPIRFESYLKRPAKIYKRSSVKESGATLERYEQDTTTGIWRTAVTNLDTGQFIPLANFEGGRMMGAENLPFGRMFRGMYTPGVAPISFYISDWQVWDSMPAHSRLPRDANDNAITTIYESATFYAPLTSTLTLTNGTGSATFTRATAAWDFNDEGKLIKLPSGAVRMRGCRPVINIVTNSYTISTSFANTRSSFISGQTDPDGGTTAYKLVEDGTASNTHFAQFSAGAQDGGDYLGFICVKAAERRYIAIRIYTNTAAIIAAAVFDLQTGTQTSTAGSPDAYGISDIGGGWYKIYIRVAHTSGTVGFAIATSNAAIPTFSLYMPSYSGDGVSGVYVWHPMLQNVTAQTDKTPGEYVSSGELSSPWHGAGADGVKYFSTYKDGTPIPEENLLGAGLNPNAVTNNLLWCRDLTNAAWVKTNATATLNQTGIGGQANACSLVEFTANNATILQTITAAAAAGCSGFYVKRHTGIGTVEFTRDNVTWTDITSLINSSTFSQVKIENTSVTNPVIGFRGQSGDKIIVDHGVNHLGTKIASNYAPTTSASVTVNAETLTYPTSGNISDTEGTILATFTADSYSSGMGNIVGSATAGLATSSSYSCQAKDGTTTINGAATTPSGSMKIGMGWNSAHSNIYAMGSSAIETTGAYDGSLGLVTIGILPSVDGYIKDVAIFNRTITSEELNHVFNG